MSTFFFNHGRKLAVACWIAAAFMVCAAMTGCDKVVKTEYDESRARVEQGTNSCSYAGWCMCSYQSFKFRWCQLCPGHIKAMHRITPYKATYESGDVRYGELRVTLSTEGQCK